MKLGLYSITYLGLWYRGKELTLPEMIGRARRYGYDGIEYADEQARLAAEFMREIINAAVGAAVGR